MKLAELISAYVSFKQALGMRYLSQAARLRSFLRAVGDSDITAVDPSAVAAFLAGTGPASWHEARSHLMRSLSTTASLSSD